MFKDAMNFPGEMISVGNFPPEGGECGFLILKDNHKILC